MEQFTQTQWPSWSYSGVDPFSTYTQLPSYPVYLADSIEAAYQSHQQHLLHNHQMSSRATESKPRLSKEEVEILEAEFQKNHKPNSSTKKALAESMRVDNARINNWFQNRRAREKKENNIRAYEARQRLEKENADGEPGIRAETDRHRDLVASSAPFPAPPTRSASQTPDEDGDSKQSLGDESSSVASPTATCSEHNSDFAVSESKYSATGDEHDDSEQFSGYLSVPDSSTPNVQASDVALQSFGSYVPINGKNSDYLLDSTSYTFMGQSEDGKLNPSFAPHSFDNQAFLDESLQHLQPEEFANQQFPSGSTTARSSLSPDMQLKSPPASDIATRRNRRPAPLSINGARSYASAMPKMSADLTAKRADFASMRRVASATGRITKSSMGAAQRSPFPTERMADGLLQLNRSPNLGAHGNSISPPTPNTPFVSGQQATEDVTAQTPFGLEGKLGCTDVVGHDPTLRTPPTTPGIMDQLFNLNAAYDMSLSDEPLATPGLARFPGEFEMPSLPASVPGYLTQDCTSQPETPLYTPHMGPAYFGYPGGNAEYNWSDASTSAKSSPGQNPQRVQFMNMTASNFSFVEEQ